MTQASTRKPRPKFLSLGAILFQIRLPLPGWVSILHRVSGVLLFLAVFVMLFMLDRSLASPEGFDETRRTLSLTPVKLALTAVVWALAHHFCAGLRYLLLDMHKGLELGAARRSALVVFIASGALTLVFAAGIW